MKLPEGQSWLCGWKEIAAYLGRREGSALRRLMKQGLPIYRPVAGGRVYAKPDELDIWLKGFNISLNEEDQRK